MTKNTTITHIDYKDVDTLKKFLTHHGRIQSRRRTKQSSRIQRELAQAIKRARFMALLPYIAK